MLILSENQRNTHQFYIGAGFQIRTVCVDQGLKTPKHSNGNTNYKICTHIMYIYVCMYIVKFVLTPPLPKKNYTHIHSGKDACLKFECFVCVTDVNFLIFMLLTSEMTPMM